MPKKIYIGLNGVAQVGKDMIGRYLVHDYGFSRVSFADGVREALLALNPVIDYKEEGIHEYLLSELLASMSWDKLKQLPEVRGLLQRMGTEVGRNMFGENVWVAMATRKSAGRNRIVYTDVRFPNEANYIKSLGGKVYQVFREGVTAVNNHSSEVLLDSSSCDGNIYNNGTLEELYAQVDALMKELI